MLIVDPDVQIEEPQGDYISWVPGNLRCLLVYMVMAQRAVEKMIAGGQVTEDDWNYLRGVRRALWALDAADAARVREERVAKLATDASLVCEQLDRVKERLQRMLRQDSPRGDPRLREDIALISDVAAALARVVRMCVEAR
jgi:hypothetical protein